MEDDIIEIKPGFAGVAINVRAAWRRVSKQGRVDRGPTVAERFLGLFDDHGVARGRIPNLVEGLSYRAVESPDALLAELRREQLVAASELFVFVTRHQAKMRKLDERRGRA